MPIRIGNTVYIDGMEPVTVPEEVAFQFERLAADYEVSKDTLDDLISAKPSGIVRVKSLRRS